MASRKWGGSAGAGVVTAALPGWFQAKALEGDVWDRPQVQVSAVSGTEQLEGVSDGSTGVRRSTEPCGAVGTMMSLCLFYTGEDEALQSPDFLGSRPRWMSTDA